MNWSTYQTDIFDWATGSTKTNLMVQAGAGCGKTSTIVELYKRIVAQDPKATVQFMAFNKKIALELQARGVPASTMNAFGFKAVLKAYPKIKLDTNKLRYLCKAHNVEYRASGFVCRVVDMLKAYLIPQNNDLISEIKRIIDEFESVDFEPDRKLLEQIASIFNVSLSDLHTIDFADQISYPHYHNLNVPRFDYVIIDEAQDLSPNKLQLVARAVGKHFICVGDPRQAIYLFCGADSESMDKIAERFSPVVKNLPVTYRCGKRIVQETHNLEVAPPDFQAGPDNHEGEVRSVVYENFLKEVKPKDFVLCRVSAPLVKNCFALIKNGVRAQIIGRDVGAKLSTLADKIFAYKIQTQAISEMDKFCEKYREYRRIEVGKLLAAEKDDQAERLEDQLDCLYVFTENVQTVGEMQMKIRQMFDDTVNPHAVIFSTIHKAKGLEADVVWALPSKMRPPKKEKQKQEEKNLLYVLITRAKNQFNWVSSGGDR